MDNGNLIYALVGIGIGYFICKYRNDRNLKQRMIAISDNAEKDAIQAIESVLADADRSGKSLTQVRKDLSLAHLDASSSLNTTNVLSK